MAVVSNLAIYLESFEPVTKLRPKSCYLRFFLRLLYYSIFIQFQDKIVWGIMPGHHDAGNEYTSLADAEYSANFVKQEGLGGIFIKRNTFAQSLHHGLSRRNILCALLHGR